MSRSEQIDAILDRHLHTREYDRQRREACKRLGICVVCRKEESKPGTTRCPDCYAMSLLQKQEAYWSRKVSGSDTTKPNPTPARAGNGNG